MASAALGTARRASALSYVDMSNPQQLAENLVQYQYNGRWYSYMLCYGGWATAKAMDDLLARGLTTHYIYRGKKTCYRYTDAGTGQENWLPSDRVQVPTTYAPGTIWREMESAKGSTINGTWTWDPAYYRFICRWHNGAVATIQLRTAPGQQVVLERRDWTGATAGLTARYQGCVKGNRVSGNVTFTYQGKTWSGEWSALIASQQVRSQ